MAVAEELHFTRAAARLYVAQQALSRDIRRLEADLGTPLFERTTRSVAMTADGERLLPRARELVRLHDEMLDGIGGARRPFVVDVVGDALWPATLLDAARERAGTVEFVARFSGGLAAALPHLLAHDIDAAFGRVEGLGRGIPDELATVPCRLEPLGLLVLEDHPFADPSGVSLSALRGAKIDTSAGNTLAPEWVDAAAQLARHCGAQPLAPHHHVVGPAETARHLRDHGTPILTLLTSPPVPGAVVVPLVDPVPLYPWSVVHRKREAHPGINALKGAVTDLASVERWMEAPEGAWIPEPDRAAFLSSDPAGHS